MDVGAFGEAHHAVVAEFRGIGQDIGLIGDSDHRLLHLGIQGIGRAESMREGDSGCSHESAIDVITFEIFDPPWPDQGEAMVANLAPDQKEVVAGLGQFQGDRERNL